MFEIRETLDTFYNLVTDLVTQNSRDLHQSVVQEQQRTRAEVGLIRSEIEATKQLLQAQASKHDANHEEPMGQSGSGQNLMEKDATSERPYSELVAEHHALVREYGQVKGALAESQKELVESERQLQNLKLQNTRLQGHLTKNATNANEIIDSDVKCRVELIRGKIQSIAKRYCVGKTCGVHGWPEEFALLDEEWIRMSESIPESFAKYKDDLRVDWIRSKIYLFLETMILNKAVFGLEGEFERKLCKLEKLFAQRNPDTDTSDWKSLTLRYSKALNMTNEALPKNTAMHIINLFCPWTLANSANFIPTSLGSKYKNPRPLEDDLIGLCEQAYTLAVLLRQSTETFKFLSISKDTQIESDEQEDLEAEEVMGPKGSYVGSKVWLTLFGALVKETPEGGRHYTVKAKVICKASKSQETKQDTPKKPLVEV